MIDLSDLEHAYSVPCPSTACSAFLGEQCISYASGKPLGVPHRERVRAAREQLANDSSRKDSAS